MIVFSSKFIERYLQERPWRALPPQRHSGNLKIGPKFQIEVYQELCEGLERPPTSSEFWDKYYQRNRTDIENLSLEEKGGLQKRVHDKAWAAFICQDHFLGLLVESGEFDFVYSSTELDTKKGIDFRIGRNHIVYGVKTHFSGTKSINGFWMTRKRWRKRDLQLNIKIIDMPLTRREAKLVGNVYLYTPRHIRELLREVELEEAQEINAEGKVELGQQLSYLDTPAAPPAATAAIVPSGVSSELEQLRMNWKQVIGQAPEDTKRTPVLAILASAGVKPVAVEGDTVVLALRYPVHKALIEKKENQQVAGKIIGAFLGYSCHVRCQMNKEEK